MNKGTDINTLYHNVIIRAWNICREKNNPYFSEKELEKDFPNIFLFSFFQWAMAVGVLHGHGDKFYFDKFYWENKNTALKHINYKINNI